MFKRDDACCQTILPDRLWVVLDPTLMWINLRKLALSRRDHGACFVENHRPAARRALIDGEKMVSGHGFDMITNSDACKTTSKFAVLLYTTMERIIGEVEDGA